MTIGFETAFVGRLAKPFERKVSRFDRVYGVAHVNVCQGPGHPDAWVKVSVFDALAEKMAATLKAGDTVSVMGKLRIERWREGSGEFKKGLTVAAHRCERLGLAASTEQAA